MMNIPSRPREKGINPFFVLTVVFLVAVSAIGIAVAAIQVIEKLPDWQNHGIPVLTVAIAFGFLIALQQARIFHSKKITRRLEKEAKVNAEKIASQQNTISAQDEKLRTNDSKLLVAEDRFAKEKERADDAERTKNHFLATMSHGIRTPLNSVLGSSALLRVTDLTTEQREYAEAIRQGSDSLLAMLTDMFDFAKIESGKVRLIEKPQNLRQCIEDVLALFSATVFKNEIDIIYFLDSQVPAEVCVDALRLKQVLLTIIGTATKFTRSGEEICLIVKVIGVKGDRCTLGFEVKDSGIGIPFDEGSSLFRTLSVIDYSITNQFGGTGIGLRNCEKLVRMMGGSIEMESSRRIGTTFSFALNVGLTNTMVIAQDSPDLGDLRGKKVLVATGNRALCKAIGDQLSEWMLVPTTINTGLEAVKVLGESTGFDLVLTDLKIGDFQGRQLAHWLSNPAATVPVIYMGLDGEEIRKEYPQMNFSVVAKPLKQSELLNRVCEALRQQRIVPAAPVTKQLLVSDFSQSHPLRILVAEDDLVNQKMILRVLRKLGYQPDFVSNGVEAMHSVNERQYDLILMDIQMPKIDGIEVTSRMRKLPILQPVIIAMTANALEGDRVACLLASMDDYLSKPVEIGELESALQKWSLHRASNRAAKSVSI